MPDKQPAKNKRRVVKDPETFRERALRASAAADDKSARTGRLKDSVNAATKPVAGPARQKASNFLNRKPMRPVRKVLSVIGKVIFPTYFRDSWRELRLVTWPNWEQSRQLTFAVLVFANMYVGGPPWLDTTLLIVCGVLAGVIAVAASVCGIRASREQRGIDDEARRL